jgi:transposase-like protein
MQRAEIITIERRRRWRLSEKQEIVAETLEPGASVSAVAQRHGMHPSQLFAWRKAARDGRLVDERGIEFAPVVVAPEPAMLPLPETDLRPAGWRSCWATVAGSLWTIASEQQRWPE